ncbi:hypothetical protein lerEdw1_013493, partial [Lerista edwardsae]
VKSKKPLISFKKEKGKPVEPRNNKEMLMEGGSKEQSPADDELAASNSFSGFINQSAPASCSPSVSLQDDEMQETLTDQLEGRDGEAKTGEDSSCEELIMEDVQEEEHKNDTEDSEAIGLKRGTEEEDAAAEGDSSEEVVESGSIGSREEEKTPALRFEEIRQRYSDLCQNSTAFQEMMLRLRGAGSPEKCPECVNLHLMADLAQASEEASPEVAEEAESEGMKM